MAKLVESEKKEVLFCTILKVLDRKKLVKQLYFTIEGGVSFNQLSSCSSGVS